MDFKENVVGIALLAIVSFKEAHRLTVWMMADTFRGQYSACTAHSQLIFTVGDRFGYTCDGPHASIAEMSMTVRKQIKHAFTYSMKP